MLLAALAVALLRVAVAGPLHVLTYSSSGDRATVSLIERTLCFVEGGGGGGGGAAEQFECPVINLAGPNGTSVEPYNNGRSRLVHHQVKVIAFPSPVDRA